MVSEATFEILEQYAEAGRIGSVGHMVLLTVDQPFPEAGSDVLVRWDFGATSEMEGLLTIPGIEGIHVQPVGGGRIRVGAEPLEIALMVAGEMALVSVTPRIAIPRVIKLSGRSRRAVMNKPLSIRWRTAEAQSCTMIIENGDRRQEYQVDPKGELEVIPECFGELRARLIVQGRHAHLSDRAVVERQITIPVDAPPVRIQTSSSTQCGFFGDKVRFEWTITGATRAVLEASARQAVYAVPMTGSMFVEVDRENESFLLIATGPDRKEQRTELKVISKLFDFSITPNELYELLNSPPEANHE